MLQLTDIEKMKGKRITVIISGIIITGEIVSVDHEDKNVDLLDVTIHPGGELQLLKADSFTVSLSEIKGYGELRSPDKDDN